MRALKSWLDRQPVWRQTVISVAALVAVVALSTQVVQTTIGGGSPSGPSSSSFATTPAGMAAYASLIRDAGGTVAQRRIGFSEGTPVSPGATLLLLDVDVLDDSEVFAVRRFLDDGGRVVAGGITGTSWINQVADTGLESAATDTAVAVLAADKSGGARSIVHAGGVGLDATTLPDEAVVVARAGDVPVVVRLGVGDAGGTMVVLANTAVLQNRSLGERDDAAFALSLIANRPAVFAEQPHGYGQRGGVSGLPARWRWCLGLLLCAALAWMVSQGRRNGPTEFAVRDLSPARREYVDALAVTLARSRRRTRSDGSKERTRDGADTSPAVSVGAGEERQR